MLVNVLMKFFDYPYNDLVICKDSSDCLPYNDLVIANITDAEKAQRNLQEQLELSNPIKKMENYEKLNK